MFINDEQRETIRSTIRGLRDDKVALEARLRTAERKIAEYAIAWAAQQSEILKLSAEIRRLNGVAGQQKAVLHAPCGEGQTPTAFVTGPAAHNGEFVKCGAWP